MRPSIRHPKLPSLAVALLMAAGSCTEPNSVAGKMASLDVVSGDSQTGVVGKELEGALEVRVLDAGSNPVPSQIVNFVVAAGGGSVFGGAAQTNSDGIAKERWTLGHSIADVQRVEVRAVDSETGEAKVFGVFLATAVADVPAKIEKVAGDAQVVTAGGQATDSLTVRVADQYDNPVTGATVNWAVSGGGSVSSSTSTTNAAGITRSKWTVGSTAGVAQQVTATVASVTPAAFTATAVAASATQLVIQTSAATATAGVAFGAQPVLRLADPNGNSDPAATNTVTMTVSSGASTVGTAAVNAVAGVATFTTAGLVGPVGNYTLTFTTTIGGVAKTASQSVALATGPAVSYVVTPSAGTVAAAGTVTLGAQLTDAGGNPVPIAGRTVTWSRTGANGSFTPTTSTTNASGVATASFTVDNVVTAPSVQLKGLDGSSIAGSVSVTVTAAAPTQLVFSTQPVNGGYGVVLPRIAVAVADQYGNTVTTDTRTITLSVAGTSLTPVAVSAANGIVNFDNVVITEPASGYTASASASGVNPATSASFNVAAIGTVATLGESFSVAPTLVLDGSFVYYTTTGPALSGSSDPDFFLTRSLKTGGASTRVNRIASTFRADLLGHLTLRGGSIDLVTGSHSNTSLFAKLATIDLDGSGVATYGATSGAGTCIMKHDAPTDGQYDYVACTAASNTIENNYAPSLVRLDPATGSQLTLAPKTLAPAHLVSGGFVYYLNDSVTAGTFTNQYNATGISSIRRISVAGGSPEVLITGLGTLSQTRARRIAIDGSTVYWAENGGGTTSGSVCKGPLAGGTPTGCIGGFSAFVANFLVDGGYLYVNDNGTIKRVNLSNDAVTTVVAATEKVQDFAIDGTDIYWTSEATGWPLRKTAKP